MTWRQGDSIHLMGIGGAGMSGLARMLLQRGVSVSGCDLKEGPGLSALRALGAQLCIGHEPSHLEGIDLLVVSSAISDSNREVVAAHENSIRVLRRAEMLADLMAEDHAVLIAGTHGKTTTTSMTVVAMQAAGADPSFAIGGALNESGTNAHAGEDPIFVAEVDESDRSFLVFHPGLAVVTNVEHDHPDEFTDVGDVIGAFEAFLDKRAEGSSALLCADDPLTRDLAGRIRQPVHLYGSDPRAEFRVIIGEGPQPHRLLIGGDEVAEFTLSVPGRHNVLNATGALAACSLSGVDPGVAAGGLRRFMGAVRRFQILGEAEGITVVDDYAHHPTELRATLAAARSVAAGRVILVVQPHRYSRTRIFGPDLGRASAAADLVIVTDVYSSGEDPLPGVNGGVVAEAAKEAGAAVRHVPHLTDVVRDLLEVTQAGDLVLITGAGDVTQVGPELLQKLGARRA